MKKLFCRSFGGVEVRVYRNSEWGNYVVKTYDNGECVADYETDNRKDAERHANYVINVEMKHAA